MNRPAKNPTLRQRKVSAFLQQRIADIILKANLAGLTGLVTITAVEVTPDLQEAKVWISVFGQKPEQALEFLNKHLYEIQGQLYKKSTMRMVPKITFFLDSSEEFSEHLSEVFRKLKK